MSITHTITTADVLALRDDLVARGRTGADVRQALRTELSGLLQLQCPPPGSSLTPEQHAERQANGFTDAQQAAHLAHQMAQLTAEHHAAWGTARRTNDPEAANVKDAHHFAQKMHVKALWAEVDRLVAEAGV